MSILISFIGPLRAICMAIDGVLYSLLDNAYDLVIKLSTAELLKPATIKSLTENLYIIFGVVAFFRLALLLVNAIIDPEKLNEKGKGLSNIFFRVVGMIILLAVTPFLFEMSYELQGKIVGADASKNIIFKTILGNNANIASSDTSNAGKALQNIALSSLITIDKSYLRNKDENNPAVVLCNYKKIKDDNGKVKGYDYTKITNSDEYNFCPLVCVSNGDGTCTPQGGYVYGEKCDWANCQNAVDTYNEMYVNEDMSPSKLASYVGVSEKIEDENGEKQEVYVYNYMFIITGVVGVAMTYIIISFAIDIAVRIFELVVLEILSPLFIATFVDPKSAQSGPFKNWLSAVGKSYASLYIRLAIIALMVLLVSIINQSKMFQSMGDVSGWAKIFMVIGLLIFAKKAPKWIGDMIGIKGDSGLGGLSIGKKLGGAALVGGALSKGLEGAKNFAGQKGKNFLANRVRNTAARVGGMKEAHADNKRLKQNGITGEAYRNNKKSLWKQGRAAAKNSRQANWGQDSQGFFKDVAQGYMGGRQNVNPSAETLSEHFKGKADLKAKMYNDKIGNTQEALQKRKENAEKLKTASQMRMGKVNLDAKGERNAKLDWQGYNEFKTAIGSDVMTEAEAYTRDMKIKAAHGENGWHLDGDKVMDGSGKEITWEDNKKTFTVAGQKDITSFTTKNFQNQSETLKTNIDLRVENDQKIAGYNAQIANLKASGVAADDASIKNLNDLVGQLKTQNETINLQNKNIINNLQTSEKSYESAPHKCPTAVQIDNNTYKTATGKFTRASENDPFVYSKDNTAAENFMLDVTVINEVMNKVANVANKNDKEAEKAHSALEPKSS